MSTASLNRLSGIFLWLGSVLLLITGIIPFFISLKINISEVTTQHINLQSSVFVMYFVLSFIAFSFILIGLPAIYLRQSAQFGKTGLIGLLLYVFGVFLNIAVTASFTSVFPMVDEGAPHLIDKIIDSNFFIYPFGSFFLCIIGAILFGIAIIRAKVFPAYIGVMFAISPLLHTSEMFVTNDTSFAVLDLLSVVSLAVALIAIGSNLVSGQHGIHTGVPISK
ncbi:hypothetical protein [Cohnella abietis]|uniref:DUF4386 domain-containing protein n=1 Tax=Cohnella abietis TaxID=2507935 RepID=A0A3T1D5I0_9BACL|nr:hypothetical protein [Cohnella abietis]BBI33357.1 hypothetical protein KCTCHS21_27560 [Cohnella abietis]